MKLVDERAAYTAATPMATRCCSLVQSPPVFTLVVVCVHTREMEEAAAVMALKRWRMSMKWHGSGSGDGA
jgi:hypothetical protein